MDIPKPTSTNEAAPVSSKEPNTNYSSKTGNQKLFIGLFVGVLIGAIFALHGLELLPGGYKYVAAVMIGAFFIVAFLLLLTVFFRDKIVEYFLGKVEDLDSFRSDAKALIGSTAEAISDHVTKAFPEQYRKNARWFAPRFANYLIWGRVRSWWFNLLLAVFLAVGGLATTVLLVNQNKLLEAQNKKIDTQNALAEGQRRSSLVLLMEGVLADVSKEIDEKKVEIGKDSIWFLDSVGYSLSTPLIGRISSLTQGFLPYQMLIKGDLTEKEYSPERAQLLLALLGSNLDSTSLYSIYDKTSFSQAYLVGANLRGADLKGVNLRGADLKGVNLRGAKLIDAKLDDANLSGAHLNDANLNGAYIISANLRGAKLMLADLISAQLMHADLSGANLNLTKLIDAKLNDANLSGAYLINADLWAADLIGANLKGADLSGANLRRTHLKGVNLSGANLNEVEKLSKGQLIETRCLYKTKGIDERKEELGRERPCLFTKTGCI